MNIEQFTFWLLSFGVLSAWVSILLKLTWWTSSIGVWFFLMSSVFGLISVLIFTLQERWLPLWAVEYSQSVIYGSLALVMWILVIDIWRKNRRHWAWSERGE